MQLAVLDWFSAPPSVIYEEIKQADGNSYSQSYICEMRKSDEYREMIGALKETWEKDLANRASASDIRKAAGSVLRTSLKRMMEMVSRPRVALKDVIAAARLTAQMTGNIVTGDDSDHPMSEKQETIASELVELMKRVKGTETVQ